MKTSKLLIAAGLLAFSFNASAATITPGGVSGLAFGNVDCAADLTPTYGCWNGNTGTDVNYAFDADEIAFETGYNLNDDGTVAFTNDLTLLYKANYDDATESGTYADYYDTTWLNTDPSAGTIFDTAGVDPDELLAARAAADAFGSSDADKEAYNLLNAQVIECGACFLYVKDGNNDPNWYIFDISTWNGTDDINLSGFWEDANGSISHVAIFGAEPGNRQLIPPVPVPASVWLFGSGLIGLVGVARRKV